jgi:hypothetical protein
MTMSDTWAALCICATAGATYLVVHVLTYRLTERYMRALFTAVAAGLGVLMAGEAWRFFVNPVGVGLAVVLMLGDVVLYTSGAFLCFNVVNVSESSIRVRILRELRKSPKPLSEAGLLEIYNDRMIIESRLARLLDSGHAELLGRRYRLLPTTPLLQLATAMRLLKQVLLRRTSEFPAAADQT